MTIDKTSCKFEPEQLVGKGFAFDVLALGKFVETYKIEVGEIGWYLSSYYG